MKTIALGDVHGRADLLAALLTHFQKESSSRSKPYRVIFLGDIIDRGLRSREAMDLVIETLRDVPGSKLLRGNHEDFVLKFIDNPFNRDYELMNWMSNGGFATALSYDVAPAADWPELKRMIPEMLAALEKHPAHIEAMRQAEHLIVDQAHVFVHAGLRPEVSLTRQSPHDMMTIRSDFLNAQYDFGLPVVHGHTVTTSRRPEIHNYRIAIDTGAEETGRLTAVVINEDAVESFIQTSVSASGLIQIADVTPEDFRCEDLLEEPAATALLRQIR